MINISKNELKSLQKIGSGCFGTVYRREDKAFKVYEKQVKNSFNDPIDNPLLKNEEATIKKLNRLIRLKSQVHNTDLIEDILYIDYRFAGIVMPYYDGKLFLELKDIPLSERIIISRELIQNARELTSHKVYGFDHRLKNIMYVNNQVKIIDLDDCFTKVTFAKNPVYRIRSILALDRAIKSLLNEYAHSTSNKEITNRIERKEYKSNISYGDISKYLDRKSIRNILLFIDNDFSLSDEVLLDNSRVIIVYDTLEISKIIALIDRLNERGISVYDVVKREDIDFYINNHSYSEVLEAKNNRIMTLKKGF